jgi:hypothetical protein
MNSAPEREGRALIQAWKNASALISIEFASATYSSFVKRQGRITTFDEKRIVLSIDASEELAVDLTGAVFAEGASASKLRFLGLDPSRYSEMVEISLGNLDRLTLFASPSR